MTTLRERIRAAELESVRRYFPPAAKVLELGGDRGHQAKMLTEWGMDVISIDIGPEPEDLVYPVRRYDGLHIPFPDQSFDVVFSSNVLEHVDELKALLNDAARVLKPGGIMVHVLPSATWRWWTMSMHYVWVLQTVVFRRKNIEAPGPEIHKPYSAHNLLRFGWAIGFPHAHGVYANAFAELYFFSRGRWEKFFRKAGYTLIDVKPVGVFYTAYKLLHRLDVPQRKKLAARLGSSCNLFVLKASAPRSSD
jgi:SAM-dependent methyltransferase